MALGTEELFGLRGATYVTGTAATPGRFIAIQALEAAVVASLTSSTVGGTLTALPIPAGSIIYGRFSTFTLTSGKVIAYNE